MNALSLTHLGISYGSRRVLNDISFDIPSGQVVGLLGRNGTGKTTLLRSLFGLIPIDAGTVSVLGRDPAREAPAMRLTVGFMSENCHLYRWMTGPQLGAFLAPFYPAWNAQAFADDCRRLELPADQPVGRMSKGTQRKLMLALTLAPAPELLLLDEPLAGLDPVARDQIRDTIIGTLADRGTTILLSSQEVDEIAPICDRVLILGSSRLLLDAGRDELAQRIRRVFVTLENPVGAVPAHPNILSAAIMGSQLELVLREFSDEALQALLANYKVRDVRTEGLSLREIFIACAGRKEVAS
ncbi:MAG TPA: ABC transporter ATP-binding protein [Candidatus Ozemobacteraceae bacterium]|nr:ABC transporter ATP-binding protein [Candidatus Ozemobacteraceae bacterium]